MNVYDAMNNLNGLYALIRGFGVIAYIVLLILMLAPYILTGYMYMCIGRKAGLNDDWMPFLPVARQLYQMKIADCPWWYALLFMGCFVNTVIMVILGGIIGLLFKFVVLGVLVVIAYSIVSLVFTFFYYQQYYPRFGFNPNSAWLHIIPVFSFVTTVLLVLMAFSEDIRYCIPGEERGSAKQFNSGGGSNAAASNPPNENSRKNAQITGLTGKYAGAAFDVSDGNAVSFGRSASDANIVFDQFDADISRKHCSIKYDSRSDQFVVTDFSTNGTYLENGSKLTPNQSISVMRGTIIYLGKNKKNSFRLG